MLTTNSETTRVPAAKPASGGTSRTEIASKGAVGRFEPRLGDPHPVVPGPGDLGVEVETHDRTSIDGEQVREGASDSGIGVGRDVERGRDVLPWRGEEVSAEA